MWMKDEEWLGLVLHGDRKDIILTNKLVPLIISSGTGGGGESKWPGKTPLNGNSK